MAKRKKKKEYITIVAGLKIQNNFGKDITILHKDKDDLWLGDDGLLYSNTGICQGKGRNWDLDRLI